MSDDDEPENEGDDGEELGESILRLVPKDNQNAFHRKEISAAKAQEQIDNFWRRTMADEVGRRVVWGLLTSCHFLEERFMVAPAGVPDSIATVYERGARDVGQRLHHRLMVLAPAELVGMHIEHDPRFARPRIRQPRRKKDGE